MSLDLNDIRIAVTLASLALFIALVVHTYSRKRHGEHAAAQRAPFDGDKLEQGERP